MSLDKLLKIRDKIADLKVKRDVNIGKLSTLKDQLKKDFDCENIEEAKEKLKRMEKDVIEREKKLDNKISELVKYFEGVCNE